MDEMCINVYKFNLIQFDENTYIAQKICSVTNKMYRVYMTVWEFRNYYRPNGKNTRHLKKHTNEQKVFLKTTCTPSEIKTIPEKIKRNINKKKWRHHLGIKDR